MKWRSGDEELYMNKSTRRHTAQVEAIDESWFDCIYGRETNYGNPHYTQNYSGIINFYNNLDGCRSLKPADNLSCMITLIITANVGTLKHASAVHGSNHKHSPGRFALQDVCAHGMGSLIRC